MYRSFFDGIISFLSLRINGLNYFAAKVGVLCHDCADLAHRFEAKLNQTLNNDDALDFVDFERLTDDSLDELDFVEKNLVFFG